MSRRARPVWTIDCETDPFKKGRVSQPFLWGIYECDTEHYHEFSLVSEVLAFLKGEYASRRAPIVYAHNGGRFDYHYLREGFNSDEPIMIVAGRFAKFKIGECECRDSLNIFTQTALSKFGGKIEIDYAKMEADQRAQHIDEIRTYMRQDCVLLGTALMAYFKDYGRGLTQAGTSMRVWSKMSKRQPPKQTALNSLYLRSFFYGGRVECFEQGYRKENFTVVDINSAYPRAMMENHPFSTQLNISKKLPSSGIEQCLIKVEGVSKGMLPFRSERGELFFPCDESTVREYCVSGWEFLTAMEFDAFKVFAIKEVISFSEHIDFKDYVLHFYGKRQEAKKRQDKVQDIFAKIFMNSLYGKFASNPENYREWVIASSDSFGRWVMEGFEDKGAWDQRRLMTRPLPESKHRYYNIATAASITGWVRAFLARSMRDCGGVLYCDTDSIAARDVSRLPQGDGLGEWKIEMQGDEWAIAGKKLYAFRNVKEYSAEDAKQKGVYRDPSGKCWKKAHKGVDLIPQEIIDVAQGKTVEYQPLVPTYSAMRESPVFIDRIIKATHRTLQ